MINYGRQDIDQKDIDAVVEVLRSDFLTQGPAVPLFEQTVSSYCGADYAIAVNSATSALHIACLALGVGKGDIVWTTPTTFVASANCALYCGATVDFVEIDSQTYNMSVDHLTAKLAEAEAKGELPKVVIPVHLCGQSCDMEPIYRLAQRYKFRIIEDAAHAIGGKYGGVPIGSCEFSDITVFSFHPVKIITTGEGGMALTNSSELADRMRQFSSHGITSDSSKMIARSSNEIWNYQQIGLGFNYRMTDIQAALGTSQMTRLDEFVEKRQEIARYYDDALQGLPVETPWQHPLSYSSYHLYPIRLDLVKIGRSQRRIYDSLHEQGVLANLHYIPVYRQPFFESMGFKQGYCPEAESYHNRSLSIPMYPTLNAMQQRQVISAIEVAIGA